MNCCNQTTEILAHALVQPCRKTYETVREGIVAKHGYDKFRDMQREAFKLILR